MKSVFLTGASGVLGSSLVPFLLQASNTRLILLMRAASVQHLQERLDVLFESWGYQPGDSSIVSRIEAVRGDVCAQRLGLEGNIYERVENETTHIIHAAGNVKLNQPLAVARKSAVDSARNIIDLAAACQQRGQFEKLEFVSTVGVAGATPGLVKEIPLEHARQFHNTYEAAKAEAEWLAWSALTSGLPGTIHRPSMIVGDSRSGKISRYQVFYHLADFLVGLRTWGIVPLTGNVKLDIIPVDYVARSILLSSDIQAACGKIFHLCSGPQRSWTLNEIVSKLRYLLEERGKKVPKLSKLPPRLARWLYQCVTPFAPANKRRLLRGLPYFLDYLGEEQQFDNSQTDAFLSAAGVTVPPVASYLDMVMTAYWSESSHVMAQNRRTATLVG